YGERDWQHRAEHPATAMTVKSCLRCDWQGKTQEPRCPNCGEHPLYVAGASASGEAGRPVGGHPEEWSGDVATTPGTAPSGPPSPQSGPPISPTDAVGTSSRSGRSAVAFVLAALVLTVAVGTWLKA